jgi:hypothetical protein
MKWNDMQYALGGRKAVQAALATLLLAASAAACSPSDADRGTAAPNTVATEPPPTTTINPYAVPTVIDEAYVNRVLAGLDAVMGDVTRLVLQTKTIPREAYDRMRSLYGDDDRLQLAIDTFQSDLRRNLAGYRDDPGNKVTTVTSLLTVLPTCVFARVVRDYSAVGVNPRANDIQWIAITPLDPARDPHNYNTTSWAYKYEGFPPDRTQPANPCAA